MKTKNDFSAPLYVKIAAKIVVKYMNKYKIDSFEMTGEKNNKIETDFALKESNELTANFFCSSN